MTLELELARVLAREVSYRSRRSFGKRGVFGFMLGEYKPSAVRANLVGAAVFTLISLLISAVLLIAPPSAAELLFSGIYSGLMIMGLFIVLLTSIGFTSVYVGERLVDLLVMFPLDERTIAEAYLLSLFLYWGGASVLFIYIPPLIAAAFKAVDPVLLIAALLASIILIVFGYALGLGLGTYAQLVRKRSILRGLATLAWLIVFVAFYSAGQLISYVSEVMSLAELSVAAYIPFIGMLFIKNNPQGAFFSAVLSVALLGISYRFAVSRLGVLTGRVQAGVLKVRAPVLTKLRVVKERYAEISVESSIKGFISKDIKLLLLREPRRLASILYFVVFPFIAFLPELTTRNPSLTSGIWLAIFLGVCGLAGGIIGLTSETLYYIEGEGAKVLYYLPITRRKLALAKAGSIFPIATIAAFALAILVSAALGDMYLGLSIFILIVSSAFSTALICSSLTVKYLPEVPSAWTEVTISRAFQLVVKLAVILALIAMAFTLPVGILLIYGSKYLRIVPLLESAILIPAGLVIFAVAAESKPL
mgnify:CR=1 FL=1